MWINNENFQTIIGSRKRPRAHPINALFDFDQNLYYFYDLTISRQTSRYSRWYVNISLSLGCGDRLDRNWEKIRLGGTEILGTKLECDAPTHDSTISSEMAEICRSCEGLLKMGSIRDFCDAWRHRMARRHCEGNGADQ